MADNCKLTAGAGGGKGLDQALETTIKGKIESEFFHPSSRNLGLTIFLTQASRVTCPTTSRRRPCCASRPRSPAASTSGTPSRSARTGPSRSATRYSRERGEKSHETLCLLYRILCHSEEKGKKCLRLSYVNVSNHITFHIVSVVISGFGTDSFLCVFFV